MVASETLFDSSAEELETTVITGNHPALAQAIPASFSEQRVHSTLEYGYQSSDRA